METIEMLWISILDCGTVDQPDGVVRGEQHQVRLFRLTGVPGRLPQGHWRRAGEETLRNRDSPDTHTK